MDNALLVASLHQHLYFRCISCIFKLAGCCSSCICSSTYCTWGHLLLLVRLYSGNTVQQHSSNNAVIKQNAF